MGTFNIVVTATRIGHKQHPLVSAPPNAALIIFSIMVSHSLNIHPFFCLPCLLVFPSSDTPTEALQAQGILNIILLDYERFRWKMSFMQNSSLIVA